MNQSLSRSPLKLSVLFFIWYTIGLVLMLFFEVPSYLQFANGLFLVFYAISLLELTLTVSEHKLKVIKVAGFTAAATFFIEVIGVKTGFPFGEYYYFKTLGPLLWGVPITISLAWVGVILNSMLISSQTSRWRRAIETGFWVVVLDLVLDPVALKRNFWFWQGEGDFYGVPIDNFISWALIGSSLSLLFPLFNRMNPILPWAFRIFESMLLMFGLLALKEGLVGIFVLSLAAVIFTEWRYRYATRRKEQHVQHSI